VLACDRDDAAHRGHFAHVDGSLRDREEHLDAVCPVCVDRHSRCAPSREGISHRPMAGIGLLCSLLGLCGSHASSDGCLRAWMRACPALYVVPVAVAAPMGSGGVVSDRPWRRSSDANAGTTRERPVHPSADDTLLLVSRSLALV